MRTYVLELDGKPKYAFRAKDGDVAVTVGMFIHHSQGSATVRLATIPEQEMWRRDTVDFGELGIFGSDQPGWPNSFVCDLVDHEPPGVRTVAAGEERRMTPPKAVS